MAKRRGVKKGIKSLEKQIEIHKEKRMDASDLGDSGLVEYYDKEIKNLEREKEKKKRHLLPRSKRLGKTNL